MSFEPYFDYEAITQEMADKLHKAIAKSRLQAENFSKKPSVDAHDAAEVLRSADDVEKLINETRQEIFRQPMIVHLAGSKKSEENPENPAQEAIIQRCKRCGSVLLWWNEDAMHMTDEGPKCLDEDEIQWWENDEVVAKCENDNGMAMYSLKSNEPLKNYEFECADLQMLEDIS